MESSSVKVPFIKGILYKLIYNSRIIKFFSNWPLYYLDVFHFFKNKSIIYKVRNSHKYKVRTNIGDLHIINSVMVAQVYHKLLKHIKKGSTVIDIGAHIGVFSIFAAKKEPDVLVYCYEPFKSNFNMLNDNIKINDLEKNVFAFQEGVCDKKGKRTLLISKEGFAWHTMFGNVSKTSHSSFGKEDTGVKKIVIKCTTLKDIIDKNRIKRCDFLKMNCEGAEYEILFGTPPGYLKKINSITIEYHPNEDIKKLKVFLEKQGFNVKIERPMLANYFLLYAERKRE